MTEGKPLMVPNNDGTDNEHQVYLITSIDSVVGLREWMDKMEERTGGKINGN